MRRIAFLDPWSPALYQDALFRDGPLNRDDVQRPWIVLKEEFERRGVECHTADLLLTGRVCGDENIYLSIGQREYWPLLKTRPNVRLAAYFQLEPPVVDPAGYKMLPNLIKSFEHVYTHNPALFGGEKLYWPQVKDGFIGNLGDTGRGKLCLINGNKAPHSDYQGDNLYIERMRGVVELGDRIDVYGPGWDRLPKWKGAPPDKFRVLKTYDFCLCFENQALLGYVTEKIFECMFAGCVPIYLGAPDIADYVDPGCFVDFRDFKGDFNALAKALPTLNPEPYRSAMAWYMASEKFNLFTSHHFAQSVVDNILY